MPSSGLVEVEIEVGVGVWLTYLFMLTKSAENTFLVKWVDGLVGGWLEMWRVELISTQVGVEVGVELGKIGFGFGLMVPFTSIRIKIAKFLHQ